MATINKNTIIRFTSSPADLPGELKNMKARWSQKDGVSTKYCTNNAVALATDFDLYGVFEMLANPSTTSSAFIGKTKTGYIAEIIKNGETEQIIMVAESKNKELKFSAAEVENGGVLKQYNADGTRKGSLVLVGLFPYFMKDEEFSRLFNEMEGYLKKDPDSFSQDEVSEFSKLLCAATNNLYYRLKNGSILGDAGINFDPEVNTLRFSDIGGKGKYTKAVYGGNAKMCVQEANATATASTGSALKGKYSIVSHDLTDEEKALVPTMAPWYITPTWVETEAKIIEASKIFPIPFRSLLLYGGAGTGKTEGAKAIFSALGLPGVSICCHIDMTMIDFFGTLIPNVEKYGDKSKSDVSAMLNIPSFEDVDNDFQNTYKKLFGKEADAFSTPADCYAKINELMTKSCSDGEPDFIYVESEFVKAYRNGWGIEIQEPTIIKRNSVLAGLNKALDNDPDAASITLPTGEVVRRHPDTVVIMTTNQDYDGCNNIQQSVLSRMQNKRQIANPTVDDLVSRTLSETSFPDKTVLRTMANIIQQINEYCATADVTDGICGPRELSNWAKRTYIESVLDGNDPKAKIESKYVLRAAFPTIIEKVSQTAEDQEAVVIEVIQKHYTEGDVMIAKDEYREGVA